MATLAGGALVKQASAAGSAAAYPRNLTKADIDRWMKELSNWGRWGKEDQAGTINLITPAKRRQAAALVKDGVSMSMSLDAGVAPPGTAPEALPKYTWQHTMQSNGIGRQDGFVLDTYSVSFHGSATTHLDALSHLIYHGKIFNGFPGDSTNNWGATKDNVMAFRDGIVTRGLLFDLPALKDVPYLGDDEAIYPEDLEAWEKRMGTRAESGDAIFIRTGRGKRAAEKGPLTGKMPGLYASCVKWLRQRDVALLGSDWDQDVRPSRVDGVDQPVRQLWQPLRTAPAEERMWCLLFETKSPAKGQ